ncbi:hypothetical protein AAV94_13950 [Lampropedia cohaerens]|uniref:RecBCD enzyme subunit RecC n=1 Tax=Lampropedia cohaerens TaxID=1610491 RepID=A0A0U1PWJ6_9BURK|nr:hypothetical protein AAV94_13950 [Lampropedia cohaerens]
MSPATDASILPGIVAIHSHRTEALAETVAGWFKAYPLAPLEPETVLVQSNGMAEWLKMQLAQQLGVCAAVATELPSRFAWRLYRRILGQQNVPYHTPLDKPDMLWRLMRLLPQAIGPEHGASSPWRPLHAMLGANPAPLECYRLAVRIADLFDQYQVYRPDWLLAWEQGELTLRDALDQDHSLPEQMHWQALLWQRLMATLQAPERAATRPHLHLRALAALRAGEAVQTLPRRVVLFGMAHLPLPILDLLCTLALHSQVLLAIPNPCQMYWGDAIDGRELFARLQRRSTASGRAAADLAAIPLHAMHAHANPLLVQWGRQVRDFLRLLEHREAQLEAQGRALPRVDRFDDGHPSSPPSLLAQVQQQVRDLVPLGEPATPASPQDRSLCFQVAHSPVRELEALHDHLLDLLAAPDTLAPRDIVVMVPDISAYAPLIQAVFGQYGPDDARHIPFAVTDLAAQQASDVVQAVEWLARLPETRVGLAELCDWLAVPAIARRFGLDAEGVAQLQHWMQGSGIRWGLDGTHRAQLGVAALGEQNTAWFGLERMLLGYASNAPWQGTVPFEEIGGLAASHVGALAALLQRLRHWQRVLTTPATPVEWAARWRAMLADCLLAREPEEQAAMTLLENALAQWLDAALEAGFAQPLPLAVARDAWLGALQAPAPTQRFHAGGVTFCTLLPMRAIPFRVVCLLGMDDGVYPRQSPPNDMDLMRLPGMFRPGDRSRGQDDRQLMLEALLSAREQLFISWVGKSVRDNSARAPSVLVAQLRDYLSARWGNALLQALTVEHPLQPFNPAYFQASRGKRALHTWAREWHPAAASEQAQPFAPTTLAPPQDTPEPPPLTLAEIAAIWRNPAEQWFARRLQTRFAPLPQLLDDCEPLRVHGLQRWQAFDALRQAVAPRITQPDASLAALQSLCARQLQRLAASGALPAGAAAAQLQQQWLQEWHYVLEHWLATHHSHPFASHRPQLLQWPADGAPRIVDWAPTPWLRRHAHETQALLLHVLPGKVLGSRKGEIRLKSLLQTWLQALLLGAVQPAEAGAGSQLRIIAVDAVLDATLPPKAQAQEWLQHIVTLAHRCQQQPLPFDFVTATTWWQAMRKQNGDDAARQQDALGKARQTYDGGPYEGQAARNPALARIWPDFAALHATGQFEAVAQAMLEPLYAWLEQHVTITAREDTDDRAEPAQH